MSLLEDFRVKLAATSAITSVVAARMFQDSAREKTVRPFVVYGRAGKETDTSLDGTTGLAKTTIAVDCVADSRDGAEDLADLLHAALHAVSGTWGSSTIRGAFVKDTDDEYIPFPKGNDGGLHTVSQIIDVHHVV